MKRIIGASRRIKRVWPTWALSVEGSGVNLMQGARVGRDRAQLTEEHQTRAEKSDDARVATLSHDGIDDGGNCASEQGGQGTHADVGHLVLDVRVADVFKLELSVKADEPSLER